MRRRRCSGVECTTASNVKNRAAIGDVRECEKGYRQWELLEREVATSTVIIGRVVVSG